MTDATPSILFFRLGPGEAAGTFSLDPTLRSQLWRPTWRRIRPPGVSGARWTVWWLMHHLHIFRNRGYAVLLIRDRVDQVVHRAGVFPRWLRYPFMSGEDLQIGDLWTAPEWRRRGIAAWAITTIVTDLGQPDRRFWYLTEAGNEASTRVIEKCGFRQFGSGHRVPRLRIRAFGQFVTIDADLAYGRPRPPRAVK